ncbi:MAG TPA: hypothetical protein VEC37_10020, partial [Bacillota bacterium]|nr:hypothetical protein [Bacillota bacterium]
LTLNPTSPPRPQATVATPTVEIKYDQFMERRNELASVKEVSVTSGPATLPVRETTLTPYPYQVQQPPYPATTEPVVTETNKVEMTPKRPPQFYVYPQTYLNTYIIASDEKGLLFIDQHAAHERILYEKYLHQAKEMVATQALLIPLTFNLSFAQYKLITERLTFFSEIGFELEAFGGKTIAVRSVPVSLLNYDYEQIILDLIEQYTNFKSFKHPAEIKESFLITMACRTAVKAGDNLKPEELNQLINDLFKCDNPYTCPHGRPTIFRMSIDELTKKFLRR